MAIPEIEPKRSSATVRESSERSRDIGSVKITISSDNRTFKTYNLYKSIKDFHFSMPSGWNDDDLVIFIESCKQNIELLCGKDENLKWAAIAECGAKKSKHPTLFKLNSCMELAKAIRSYMRLKRKNLEGNPNFRKFCDDIADMLPFFPDLKEKTPRRRRSLRKCQSDMGYSTIVWNRYSSPSVKQMIDLILLEVKEVTKDTRDSDVLWESIKTKFVQNFGIGPDVKYFLYTIKDKIIHELRHRIDPEHQKGLLENYLEFFSELCKLLEPPLGAEDILEKKEASDPSSNDKKDNSYNLHNGDHKKCVKEEPVVEVPLNTNNNESGTQLNDLPSSATALKSHTTNNIHLTHESTIKNTENNRNEKNGNAKHVSAEPNGKNQGPKKTFSNIRLKQGNSSDNKQPVDVELSDDSDDDISSEEPDSPNVRRLRRGVRGPRRFHPTRILPIRVAKIRSKTNPSRRRNSSSSSEDLFKGFEEDVSFEESRAYVVQRQVTFSLEEYQMNIPNSDTTNASSDIPNPDATNASRYDSDSGFSNSPRNSNGGGQPNFSQGQRIKKKTFTLNMVPDSTMQPVVLLNKLDIFRTSGYVDPSLPSTSGNSPVESAVQAKDIVQSVYDPKADSAKIIADPPSPPQSRIVGRKRLRQVLRKIKNDTDSEESSGELTDSSGDFKSYSRVKSSTAKMPRDSLTKTTCTKMQGTSAVPVRPRPQTHIVPRPPSRSEAHSPRSIEFSSTAHRSGVPSNPVNAVAVYKTTPEAHQMPSTSSQEVDVYHRRPTWLDDYVRESRSHSLWKIRQLQKMQQELLVSENKKQRLIEDLIKVLSTKN